MTLPKPQPAWPAEQGKIQFDASYEPVASQGRLFVPSMAHDHVTAYDLETGDRKSTRLNSSHVVISYAVFCLKKKNPLSYPPP